MTEDETVGWYHRRNEHELDKAPGVGDGQGSLVCCSPWGHKKSGMTEWLNWTERQEKSHMHSEKKKEKIARKIKLLLFNNLQKH